MLGMNNGFARYRVLRDDVLGQDRIWLTLTGDLHYYKRMQGEDAPHGGGKASVVGGGVAPGGCGDGVVVTTPQLIVAGHGGAFGHPTSFPRNEEVTLAGRRYVHAADYPSPSESDRLWRENWRKSFIGNRNRRVR